MDIVRESRKVHKEHKEKVLETLLKQEQEKDEDNVTITIEIKIPKREN